MDGSMIGKVAVVTGGATGLGAAVSRRLAERGAHVAIVYSRSAAEAEATAEECRGLGVEAITVQGDVGDDAACRAVADEVVARFGRIDVLVNNAGRTKAADHRDLDALDGGDFLDLYRVNVVGAFQMTRAVAPHLRAQGAGAVVNVSSTSSTDGSGSSMAYAASKAALNTLTISLARSLAPEVRVNAVLPGFIATGWYDAATRDSLADEFRTRTPLRRAGTAEDIAVSVVFLCDEGARHITGSLLVSDAGATLKPLGLL
ncbi:SDR family oxidoreductase [Pseudonocardia ailaonensis]